MNIYQKLVEVRKVVPYLQKSSKGHQYNYVSSSQVLAAVRAKMDELGLLLIPRVTGHNVREDMVVSQDKYGNEKHTTTYFTELDMTFTWVNAENPEEMIECPMYAQGVDIAGEKGVGKAMTYAEKFFLLKQFNIATDQDDPDRFQAKHGLDNTNQPLHEQTYSEHEQIPNVDGQLVTPKVEAPSQKASALWSLLGKGPSKLAAHVEKQIKLGYSMSNIENNLAKEVKVPESIAQVWLDMYGGDAKKMQQLQPWFVQKRLEGMTDETIEVQLANTIAQQQSAAAK